jgi:hypothetical protein
VVRGARLDPFRFPARGLGGLPRRGERPRPRAHRHGEDLRRLAGPAPGVDGAASRAGAAAPAAGGRSSPAGALDHPSPRPGRGHRGLSAGSARRAGNPLDPGAAHGGHTFVRPRTAARPPSHGPGDHAREPLPLPLPPRRPGAVRRSPARGRGRVARAPRGQARSPDRAGSRPPAPLPAGPPRLGALGHPGQPRRRPRVPRGDRRDRPARTRPRAQGDPHRLPPAGHVGALPLGRAPGPPAPPPGRGRRRGGRDRPRVHQHPLADRDLVPGPPRRPPGLGRGDRPPPRLARPQGAGLGRGRASPGEPPLRRVHLQPGPGRGLRARGPGAPGGEPQGDRAARPAGRPERPPAGAPQPGDLRPHQRLRAGGGGRRPPSAPGASSPGRPRSDRSTSSPSTW